MRRLVQCLAVTVMVFGSLLALVPPAANAAPPSGASKFVPVGPDRILDTRVGTGVPAGVVAPGGVVELAVADRGSVPGNATAVVLNVTVDQATGPGYVQVFPTGGGTIGDFSNLNVEGPGQTIPNLVVVPIGDAGRVSFYMQGGGHLIADVFGYFVATDASAGGRFQAIDSGRLIDTRQIADGKLGAGEAIEVPVLGERGVPSSGVSAVVLNVTATEATNPGYVQVLPGNDNRIGGYSNLNIGYAGQTIPNLVTVPMAGTGSVVVYSEAGTHVIVDVLGYFTDNTAPVSDEGLFVPVLAA